MNWMQRPVLTLRILGALVALSLFSALIAQFGFDLAPCDLCIYQRYPALVALISAIAAEFIHKPKKWLGLFALSCFVTFLIAAYHTGVEQHWWAAPESCGKGNITLSTQMSLNDIKAAITTTPFVRCDKPAFELWGITMANANATFSLFLSLIAIYSIRNAKGCSKCKS